MAAGDRGPNPANQPPPAHGLGGLPRMDEAAGALEEHAPPASAWCSALAVQERLGREVIGGLGYLRLVGRMPGQRRERAGSGSLGSRALGSRALGSRALGSRSSGSACWRVCRFAAVRPGARVDVTAASPLGGIAAL